MANFTSTHDDRKRRHIFNDILQNTSILARFKAITLFGWGAKFDYTLYFLLFFMRIIMGVDQMHICCEVARLYFLTLKFFAYRAIVCARYEEIQETLRHNKTNDCHEFYRECLLNCLLLTLKLFYGPFMCICNWNSFIKVCPFPYLFLVNNIDQK